jgi:hypothetical protein
MRPAQDALVGRRSFFKSLGMAAGAGAFGLAAERDAEAALAHVNPASKPSDLKITDLRVAVVGEAPMNCPLLVSTRTRDLGLRQVARRRGLIRLMLKTRLWARTRATSTGCSGRSSSSAATRGRGGLSGRDGGVGPGGQGVRRARLQMLGGSSATACGSPTPAGRGRPTAGPPPQTHGRRPDLAQVDVGLDLVANVPGAVSRDRAAELSRAAGSCTPSPASS